MKTDELSLPDFEAEVAAVLEAIGDEIESQKKGVHPFDILCNVQKIWGDAEEGKYAGKAPRGWWRKTTRRMS